MSHHLDSPQSRRDPRLNLTDLYVFDGENGADATDDDAAGSFTGSSIYAIVLELPALDERLGAGRKIGTWGATLLATDAGGGARSTAPRSRWSGRCSGPWAATTPAPPTSPTSSRPSPVG